MQDEVLESWSFSVPEGYDNLRVVATPVSPVKGQKHRIMVIYPRKSSAYDLAISTIFEHFRRNAMNVEVVISNFEQDPLRGADLVREAHEDNYGLIFAMGSETVSWLHSKHSDIGTPVVTVCAKDPVLLEQMPGYDVGSGSSFAFTSLNVRLDVQMEYLRKLKRNLKNIAILVDMKNASAVETQARPLENAARALGINAFMVPVTDPERAAEQLEALLPKVVKDMQQNDPTLENSVFWITGSTSVFAEIETITRLNQGVPVLAAVPEVVQPGSASAVLSIGISFQSNAQLAAFYGSEVLNGHVRPGDLKVGIVSPPDIAINFARARADGLQIPFSFFEAATFVYDAQGRPARVRGLDVQD
ncbi:ABC transporter substrate-binding protein [Tabrizicola sp.]|uniref:ABC transporter substrate-binding protein n=1 Tax=Tabrizicola sp. TaxID=2005166 RepID=UPI003D2E2EBF